MESNDKGLVCYFSIKAYRWFFGFGAPALKCFDLIGVEYKYWSSPDLNSMRWLGLFRNKTFRKHLKLIFPLWDFIICIVSLEISVSSPFCHPHFVIRIFPSAFYHPHFSIRILSSAFFYPPSAAIRSALYRDPKKDPRSVTEEWFCKVRHITIITDIT